MLPILNEERYMITLPISGKTIEIRPWLCKEEKLMLIAKESKDPEKIANAVINILKACSFNEDVEKLPMVDVEYMLLQAKSFSSGEISAVNIRCNNLVDNNKYDKEAEGSEPKKKCGHVSEVDIDLHKEVSVTGEIPEPRIRLTDSIGVVMKPIEFSAFKELLKGKSLAESTFSSLASAIDYVWQEDEIFKNFSPDEADTFLENFNDDQLKLVRQYIKDMPKLQVKHDYKCSSCGYKGQFVLENLFNFFIG